MSVELLYSVYNYDGLLSCLLTNYYDIDELRHRM